MKPIQKSMLVISLMLVLVACPPAPPVATTARVQVQIQWAIQTSLRPLALPSTAQSLRVTASSGGTSVNATVNKPTSSLELEVPSGSVDFVAQAYSGANTTGALLASTNTVQTIQAGVEQTVNLSFPLGAGVNRLGLSLSKTDLTIGATSQAAAQAFDLNNAVLSGLQLQFSSSNPNVATINPAGLIQALTVGTTTITVQEQGSGKSTSVTLTVTKTTVVISGA